MVFWVSEFDKFSLFERILQFDTEFAETLGGDTFSPFDTESGFDRAELFEWFLKVVFRFSGFDRFSLFERILQFDTEFTEKFGGNTFSPFDTESGFDRAELFEWFLKVVFRFSGFDRFALFERILQFDTEFAEKFGGNTFSPFDTESVFKI